MLRQLEHVMDRMRSPDITVQVLPYSYSAGASPSHLPLTPLSANGKPHAVHTDRADGPADRASPRFPGPRLGAGEPGPRCTPAYGASTRTRPFTGVRETRPPA